MRPLPGLPPPDAPVRLAVFDCDGTLVDGQADICTAMHRAFATLGLPPPAPALIRRTVGLSLPQAMRALAPAAEPDLNAALVAAYKDAYRTARAQGHLAEPLFPHIADTLAALAQSGWTLAIATGKSRRGLAYCLATHNLTALFNSLHTADDHPSKPHPAMLDAAMAAALAPPAATVMIGDTAYDIAMAHAASATPIGVAWGYHTRQELLAAGALAVAESPADLVAMLG